MKPLPLCVDDKAPWIDMLGSEGETLSVMRCGRCGTQTSHVRGTELSQWTTAMKAFMRTHRKCLPKNVIDTVSPST